MIATYTNLPQTESLFMDEAYIGLHVYARNGIFILLV